MILTREQVERASRREGVTHPVISTIECHEPEIAQFNSAYMAIVDGQERQRYIGGL